MHMRNTGRITHMATPRGKLQATRARGGVHTGKYGKNNAPGKIPVEIAWGPGPGSVGSVYVE